MIIRQAEPSDALAIATIHVRSWQHAYRDLLPEDQLAALSLPEREVQWQQLLTSGDGATLVAENNGAVTGFARWGLIPESDPVTAFLYSIYMLPELAGRGIGSHLLRETEAQMISAGAELGSLHVLAENAPTIGFYMHHGWQPEPGSETWERFYGIDVLTMTLHKVFT